MNVLQEFDADGQLVRERPIGQGETIRFSLGQGHSYTITPPAGYQLNGHLTGCRCGECRPDLYVASAWVPSYDPWKAAT
jgi:hypothetical protein